MAAMVKNPRGFGVQSLTNTEPYNYVIIFLPYNRNRNSRNQGREGGKKIYGLVYAQNIN